MTRDSLNIHLYPSITSWWARQMRLAKTHGQTQKVSMCSEGQQHTAALYLSLFMVLNFSQTSSPNKYPAPRGDKPQPSISSGSDHIKSHMGPSCGTSAQQCNSSNPTEAHVNNKEAEGTTGARRKRTLLAVDDADLVQRVDGRRQAAVDAKNAVIDDGAEGEVVKDVGAVPPHVHRPVLALTAGEQRREGEKERGVRKTCNKGNKDAQQQRTKHSS